ncbi:MAG: flavodoxin family protein [Thermodesulfobacteriota bacterium]
MKALVTYFSKTGNTEKVAQAIYDGIAFVEKEILPIKFVKDMKGYDLFFVGFPVQGHSIPAMVEKFVRKIPDGKKVAFFGTHGSLRGGVFAITAFYYAISLAPKKKVLGTFGCRGRVKAVTIEKLLKSPQDKYWAMEAQSASQHPDQQDLEDAIRWARWMVMKAGAE